MKKMLFTIGALVCSGAVWLSLLSKPLSGASAAADASLPVITSTLQLGGSANTVSVVGSTAYVGIGPRLHIFDVADPANPVHLGQTLALPGTVQDVAVTGGMAYLAVDYGTLPGGAFYLYDVTNPLAPTLVSQWHAPAGPFALAVYGGDSDRRIYLAADEIYILNLVDPSAPQYIAMVSTPAYAFEARVSGSLLFVGDGQSLRIYDLTNPDSPSQLGEYSGYGYVKRLALQPGYAYLANGINGMAVLDVSNPANPHAIGSFDTSGQVNDVLVAGNIAYLADTADGLVVLDISDPAHPAFLGSNNTPGNSTALALESDYIYFANGIEELVILNIGNPAAPTPVSWWRSAGSPSGMHATSERLIVADHSGRLHVYDISSIAAPVELGVFEGVPGSTMAIAATGGSAYLAGDYQGLVVLDVSNYGAIKLTGWLPYSGELVYDVVAAGSNLYLANMNGGLSPGGLRIVDVSNPYSPQQIGQVDATGSGFSAVQFRASQVFVAGDDKLIVFSVSNPSSPVALGSVNLDFAKDLVVVGDYAYVASRYSGVSIVDISNPASPSLVRTVGTGDAYSIAAVGDLLYVADLASGLAAIDISNPLEPTRLANFPAPYDFFFVTTNSSYAFAADFEAGLMAFSMGAVAATDFIYLPQVSR